MTSRIVLILLCFSILTCHPRSVVRDGVRMSYDEAASLDFRLAEEAFAQGKKDEAILRLRKVLKNYPDSEWSDDVYSKLGDIYLAYGQYHEASLQYQIVLEDFLFSSLKTRATLRLGICLFKLEKYGDSAKMLSQVANRFSEPIERLEIYTLLTKAYEKINQPIEAVPYYVSMVRIFESNNFGQDLQTPYVKIPSPAFCRERVIAIITETEDQRALRQFISEYGSSFPAQYALLRLANLQIAEQKTTLAEANLEELLRRFPNDPFAEESRTRLRRIQSRYLVNENRVGIILPLTGKYAALGIQALQGIELAVSLSRDSYPNSGVEFIMKDSKGDGDLAAKLVSELVTEHQVIAIIGSIGSDSGKAAQEAQNMSVPMLTLSSAPSLADIGDYIFQYALLPQKESQALVRYAIQHPVADVSKSKKFAILYPNNDYGVKIRDLFWDEVLAQGGEIAGCEPYKPGQTDFKKEISKLVGLYYHEPRKEDWERAKRKAREKKQPLRDARPEPIVDFGALFIPDAYTRASIIADHLPLYDVEHVLLLGNSNWNDPALPGRSRHVEGAVFTDGFFAQGGPSQTRAFVSNYQTTFEQLPHRITAYAYDSAEILVSLLQDSKNHNRDSLQSALSHLKQFEGVTGMGSFAQNGALEKEPVLLTVTGKEIVEVKH